MKFLASNNWTSINIRINTKDVDDPLFKMVSKKITYHGKTLNRTTVLQYFLVDTDLNVEKIEDLKPENTTTLIQRMLNANH